MSDLVSHHLQAESPKWKCGPESQRNLPESSIQLKKGLHGRLTTDFPKRRKIHSPPKCQEEEAFWLFQKLLFAKSPVTESRSSRRSEILGIPRRCVCFTAYSSSYWDGTSGIYGTENHSHNMLQFLLHFQMWKQQGLTHKAASPPFCHWEYCWTPSTESGHPPPWDW